MKKIFYDYLIKTEEITVELEGNDITEEEKNEFVSLIDETFHLQILETILDFLPKEYHEIFLELFDKSPQDENLLAFLTEKTSLDFEDIINKKAKKIKKELLGEIKRAKRK